MVEKKQLVKVYSNAKEVSLWQNGKMLVTKPVGNNLALFLVEWQEGDNRLEARAGETVDQTLVTYKKYQQMLRCFMI